VDLKKEMALNEEQQDWLESFRGLTANARLGLYVPLRDSFLVTKSGREVMTPTQLGRDEYERRRRFVWLVYDRHCRLCGRKLKWEECSVDHIAPRGMGAGSRDDSVYSIWPAHLTCNQLRGSRRVEPDTACLACGHDVVLVGGACLHCGAK